jgi:hypothetical protein
MGPFGVLLIFSSKGVIPPTCTLGVVEAPSDRRRRDR